MPVLQAIRNLRAWAIREHIDPWALRQGLLVALEMDTAAALARGVSKAALDAFDVEAKKDIRAWIHEQGKGRGYSPA